MDPRSQKRDLGHPSIIYRHIKLLIIDNGTAGTTLSSVSDATKPPLSPLSSRAKPRDLQFSLPQMDM
jgi:hypothetical protein